MTSLSHHAQHHEPQSGHSGKPSYVHIYIFSAVAAIGGLLFGYDTGTISGADRGILGEVKAIAEINLTLYAACLQWPPGCFSP